MLPQRALTLISEYSKPLMRSDWKTYKPMTLSYYKTLINNSRINAVLKELRNKKDRCVKESKTLTHFML